MAYYFVSVRSGMGLMVDYAIIERSGARLSHSCVATPNHP